MMKQNCIKNVDNLTLEYIICVNGPCITFWKWKWEKREYDIVHISYLLLIWNEDLLTQLWLIIENNNFNARHSRIFYIHFLTIVLDLVLVKALIDSFNFTKEFETWAEILFQSPSKKQMNKLTMFQKNLFILKASIPTFYASFWIKNNTTLTYKCKR